jgi:hypothetical protein
MTASEVNNGCWLPGVQFQVACADPQALGSIAGAEILVQSPSVGGPAEKDHQSFHAVSHVMVRHGTSRHTDFIQRSGPLASQEEAGSVSSCLLECALPLTPLPGRSLEAFQWMGLPSSSSRPNKSESLESRQASQRTGLRHTKAPGRGLRGFGVASLSRDRLIARLASGWLFPKQQSPTEMESEYETHGTQHAPQ